MPHLACIAWGLSHDVYRVGVVRVAFLVGRLQEQRALGLRRSLPSGDLTFSGAGGSGELCLHVAASGGFLFLSVLYSKHTELACSLWDISLRRTKKEGVWSIFNEA